MTVTKDKNAEHSYLINSKGEQQLPNGKKLDWNKGMIWQCGEFVGEYYEEWIHHPQKRSLRLFDNSLCESLSFIAWWLVPVIFIPWSLLELSDAFSNPEYHNSYQSPMICIIYFVIGYLIWTLLEFVYHRYAFHWKPTNSFQRMMHFLLHGQHHLVPADPWRLVMPPSVNVPLALLHRWIVFHLFPKFGEAPAMFAGGLFGYCLYECTHYLIHHSHFASEWLDKRADYHNKHHYHPDKRDSIYGVSHQLWDYVFDTL